MLNAIGSPLVFSDFCEDVGASLQKFVDDPVLRRVFQVFERVLGVEIKNQKEFQTNAASYLDHERSRFMAGQRSPLALKRLVDTN